MIMESTEQFNDFFIAYDNADSATSTFDEIFHTGCYEFATQKKYPFIIDAGSNIGIATLFFKTRYPGARILCFEPDPYVFQLLEKNIAGNQLQGVTLVNAAVVKKPAETINFFGQVGGQNPDTRGNSILEIWGRQRTVSQSVPVNAVRLSSYIHGEVDFLKLDIEGAEQQVLEELSDKLPLIKEIAIEVHEAEGMQSVNDVKAIVQLLREKNFTVSCVERNIQALLPEAIQEWVKKVNPRLFIVKAQRKL